MVENEQNSTQKSANHTYACFDQPSAVSLFPNLSAIPAFFKFVNYINCSYPLTGTMQDYTQFNPWYNICFMNIHDILNFPCMHC